MLLAEITIETYLSSNLEKTQKNIQKIKLISLVDPFWRCRYTY